MGAAMSIEWLCLRCGHALRSCGCRILKTADFSRAVYEQRRFIVDDDPGDMDAASPVHERVVTEWRRAGE
jgi:hypothetical protein